MWTLTSPTWFVSTLMSPDGNGVYINLFCILRPSSHFTDYWLIFFFFSSFFLFQWSLFDHDTTCQRRGRFFCTWLAGCMVSTHTVICTWRNCYVDCFTQTWCIVCCKFPYFISSVASIDLPLQKQRQIYFSTLFMTIRQSENCNFIAGNFLNFYISKIQITASCQNRWSISSSVISSRMLIVSAYTGAILIPTDKLTARLIPRIFFQIFISHFLSPCKQPLHNYIRKKFKKITLKFHIFN